MKKMFLKVKSIHPSKSKNTDNTIVQLEVREGFRYFWDESSDMMNPFTNPGPVYSTVEIKTDSFVVLECHDDPILESFAPVPLKIFNITKVIGPATIKTPINAGGSYNVPANVSAPDFNFDFSGLVKETYEHMNSSSRARQELNREKFTVTTKIIGPGSGYSAAW